MAFSRTSGRGRFRELMRRARTSRFSRASGWIGFVEHLVHDLAEGWRGAALGEGPQGGQRFWSPHPPQRAHPGLEEIQILLVPEEAPDDGTPFRPGEVVAELQGEVLQFHRARDAMADWCFDGTDEMAKKKGGWRRRILLGLAWMVGAGIAVCVLLVLVFRFVPVPVSGLMVQRRLEGWSGHKPYTSHHRWVPLEEISPSLGVAVIAAEDQTFTEHFGFDWQAIEKAVQHNEHSRRKRGASTVSQQTAKNLFLWNSRSWTRKGLEAWFTLLIEVGWSKKRILEVYLNIVEFGDGVYGAEAAARTYFGKPAKRLTPSEAALLAAVLPNPRKFRANAPNDYVRGRQAWILNQMRQLGGEQLVKDLES